MNKPSPKWPEPRNKYRIDFRSVAIHTVIAAVFLSVMLEIAKNLWNNWGTTSFWLSTLCAGVAGVLFWWGIGLLFYLSAPRTTAQAQPTPAVQQSIGNISGSATVNQAGRDVVINQGISVTEMLKLLTDAANNRDRILAQRYPLGWVIFGVLDNGQVAYRTSQSVNLDPSSEISVRINPTEKTVTTHIEYMGIDFIEDKGNTFRKMEMTAPYVENQPSPWAIGVTTRSGRSITGFTEVLDIDKGIFVIGFK